MDATTTTRARSLVALMAMVPLVAACGGGHDGNDDEGAWGAAAQPTVARGADLVITTDNGVRLRPADGDRVGVGGHIRHEWSHRDDTWVLDLSCPKRDDDGRESGQEAGRGSGQECDRMPEVNVPEGTSVTVSARNAGIDVAGVSAALDLTTVNGDVTVTRSGRKDAAVRLETRNGSVRAGTLRADDLHAETVNGDVTLDCATSPGGVGARTTNGSVRVVLPHDAPAYRIAATTDNGRPSVTVPTGDEDDDRSMTLTTVNGDVTAGVE
ncbi:hypothetical protein C6Y14_15025 [Streptomyces dioscori]|uniref:DUF4097 domain-containing protein n=1 Tax=Streptomyces dioscori TaxID=2109333 RepID=A0A2P8Q8F6_9ACTN|nr:DUF4097 family beta strand repeat-containing protein [Streptomyces dioscori]PSM42520.1 hypothetical protein C6Y14_15025 [Streptomyces dioscori]